MLNNLLIIPGTVVEKCISMVEAIDLMRNAFSDLTAGLADIPDRTNLNMPLDSSDALIMPVYSSSTQKYGVKVVSLNQDNYKNNLPLIHAIMMLFDSTSGKPLALLDAEKITAVRTGAASGLATNILARLDSSYVALFGTGVQARTQLEAVCAVRNIRKAIVFTKDIDNVNRFIEEVKKKLSIEITFEENLSLLREADIICTATTSATPLFEDEHISEGTHINAIGSYKPDLREIPSMTLKRAKTVVDSKRSCLKEAGDIIIPMNEGLIKEDHIYAEIGELISNHKEGRTNNSEITFFKSVGSGIQDLLSAIFIFEKAKKLELGQFVEL
jgi:ornithine cyclodeaminase/alanine dehydrogenase-like protein (mu-crystallin family)